MASVNAQERTKKPSLKLGPFQVSVVAPFTAGVDSNVYNTPGGVSDETFTLAPTLRVLLPLGRRARIIATGGVAPYYFHSEKSENHTDLIGSARAEVDAGPLTFFGGLSGARLRQRFSLEIDERIQRNESGSTFGATIRLRKKVALTASQINLTSTYDPNAVFAGQPVSSTLDRDMQTRTVQLSVPLTRKTSLAPFVDLIEDRFLSAPEVVPPVKSSRYGATFEFSELAFFNGLASVGIRHFEGGGSVPPYNGPFLAVNLAMPFVLGSRLQVTAARDVTYSAIPSAGPGARQTYVTASYGATVIFELPLKLQGRIRGGYDETRYLAFQSAEGLAVPPGEHGDTVGAALLRHLGRHLSLGGEMRFVNRTSQVEGRSYSDRVYGVAGEISF